MNYVAVHQHPQLALAVSGLVVPAGQVQAFMQAQALADELASLRDREAARQHEAREAAQRQGHAQGFAEGRADGERAALDAAAATLAETLARLAARVQREQADLQEQVVELALLVLQQTLHRLDRADVLAALLRQAFARLAGPALPGAAAPALAVRLHPALLEAVRERCRDGADALPAALQWRADEALAPFDCVLDTPGGRVLAGLPVQLERVRQALAAAPPARAAAEVSP